MTRRALGKEHFAAASTSFSSASEAPGLRQAHMILSDMACKDITHVESMATRLPCITF